MTARCLNVITISTHSLTRRLTGSVRLIFAGNLHFNSQPHKEADEDAEKEQVEQLHFNSQPHKEADVFSFVLFPTYCISTHSLTRRLTK